MLYEHEFPELHYRKSNSPARYWRGYLMLQVSGGYSSGGRGGTWPLWMRATTLATDWSYSASLAKTSGEKVALLGCAVFRVALAAAGVGPE